MLQKGERLAVSDIQLTPGIRGILLSMQSSASLMDRTQNRLSTGRRVNTALDDPIIFFAARAHQNRASDLLQLKDGIQEAVQVVAAADHGLTGITDLLTAAQALAQTAFATNKQSSWDSYATQFDEVLSQIDTLAGDSRYRGTNLLISESLTVTFSEDSGQSLLTFNGVDATSTGLGINTVSAGGGNPWTSSSAIQTSLAEVSAAFKTARGYSQLLSSNSGLLTVRRDFNDRMVNILGSGAENLTLADMNEEGANMLMLQTRQSIQAVGMTMATQAAQGVLRIF